MPLLYTSKQQKIEDYTLYRYRSLEVLIYVTVSARNFILTFVRLYNLSKPRMPSLLEPESPNGSRFLLFELNDTSQFKV